MSKSLDIILPLAKSFLENKCPYKENEEFKASIALNESKDNEYPTLFDNDYNIQCVINLDDNNYDVMKNNKNNIINCLIKKSNFDILFYKTNNKTPTIGIIIILIINEIEILKDSNKKIKLFSSVNINLSNEISDLIKLFVFEYIKSNLLTYSFPHWMVDPVSLANHTLPFTNYLVENLLLGMKSIGRKISLLNTPPEIIKGQRIEKYVNFIENVISPAEIVPLKINKEIFNYPQYPNVNNGINQVYLNTFVIHNDTDFLQELKKNYLRE